MRSSPDTPIGLTSTAGDWSSRTEAFLSGKSSPVPERFRSPKGVSRQRSQSRKTGDFLTKRASKQRDGSRELSTAAEYRFDAAMGRMPPAVYPENLGFFATLR